MKLKLRVYLITIALIFGAIFKVIPNLMTESSEYIVRTKTLENTLIDNKEYYKGLAKLTKRTLVLNMTDGSTWQVDKQYSKYWDELQDKKHIGKSIRLFIEPKARYTVNPIKIEIDNKTIYGPTEQTNVYYGFLILTFFLIIYSSFLIWTSFNTKRIEETKTA